MITYNNVSQPVHDPSNTHVPHDPQPKIWWSRHPQPPQDWRLCVCSPSWFRPRLGYYTWRRTIFCIHINQFPCCWFHQLHQLRVISCSLLRMLLLLLLPSLSTLCRQPIGLLQLCFLHW